MSNTGSSRPFSLRFGTAPVNWNNFDLVDWRPPVPFPAILDEMRAAGYVSTEWDASFGTDIKLLNSAIASREMTFVGAYRWVDFVDDDRFAQDLEHLAEFFPILRAIGISNLIVSDALRPMRVANAGAIPDDGSLSLALENYQTLASNLHRLADQAAPSGLAIRYHNHVGSWIETPTELATLMDHLDFGKVDLCFDTGHYAFGGGDPHAFITSHLERIGLLHLKDVDDAVLTRSRANRWSFQDALRQIIFCPLGDGGARIPEVLGLLAQHRFCGSIIIEQDTCAGDSTATARLNLERAQTYAAAAEGRHA